jgi:hypothetical protein
MTTKTPDGWVLTVAARGDESQLLEIRTHG